jgi:N-acetylglucosaminyldiphosphoundecaprenol N-acetyl-beta-D-mannosaminyltransferase
MSESAVMVLGVRFAALTRRQAAEKIARLAAEPGPYYVVKPYSEFMPRAVSDARVREILNGASLCLADGAGIIWAAHYLALPGRGMRALAQFPASFIALLTGSCLNPLPLPQAMAGVDFTWEMLDALEVAGRSVYLLGGTEVEAEAALQRILERLPGLVIAGSRHGHFSTQGRENEAVVAGVAAASPDVLLVGMGFPRQEMWIAENLGRLNVRVAVAEGGSFSFISGRTSRAPRWMRRSGLEWLYRLGRQPWRWRRQLALPRFVWLVLRQRLSR